MQLSGKAPEFNPKWREGERVEGDKGEEEKD